ncbi:hypothetical protein CBL_00759 [Carabus blaptoides fortunei]
MGKKIQLNIVHSITGLYALSAPPAIILIHQAIAHDGDLATRICRMSNQLDMSVTFNKLD